jgi:hypothetical protein
MCGAFLAAGGQPEALLMLAPLLLLLSQDPLLLRQLGERQRYLPPVAAISGYIAITAVIQVGISVTGQVPCALSRSLTNGVTHCSFQAAVTSLV